MRAGALRQRITLQALVAGSPQQTPSGESAAVWTDIVTVYARVSPLSGRELFAAQQYASEVTHAIRVRWRAEITDRMRVKFGTRFFTIHWLRNLDERDIEIELLCSEGLAAQV